MNNHQIDFYKILVTALITSMIAALFTFLLTRYQLGSEHDYWKARFKREKMKERIDKQLYIVDEFNESVLQLDVMIRDIKIELALFNTSELMSGISYEDNRLLYEKILTYQNAVNQYTAVAQKSILFFNDNVDSLINKLGKTLSAIFSNEDMDLLNQFSIHSISSSIEVLNDFNTNRINVIDAMYTEISITSSQLYEN